MTPAIDLDSMSTEEKLRLLEAVWQNLSQNPDSFTSPAWHGQVLEERDKALERGESKLHDWSEAKQRLRQTLG